MPPPPPKKINPLVEKIFFHEKSLGNDIPCKLSKSGVPTPSEREISQNWSDVFFYNLYKLDYTRGARVAPEGGAGDRKYAESERA